MELHELLGEVANLGDLRTEDDALVCLQATLETLGERLAGGEPSHLASQLPQPLAQVLPKEGKAERFSAVEFVNRVARKEGVDPQVAATHARAVFAALKEAVSPGEFEDIKAQLPKDYEGILGEPISGNA